MTRPCHLFITWLPGLAPAPILVSHRVRWFLVPTEDSCSKPLPTLSSKGKGGMCSYTTSAIMRIIPPHYYKNNYTFMCNSQFKTSPVNCSCGLRDSVLLMIVFMQTKAHMAFDRTALLMHICAWLIQKHYMTTWDLPVGCVFIRFIPHHLHIPHLSSWVCYHGLPWLHCS